MPAYKRILLKLSGEALTGADGTGIDPEVVSRFADELVDLRAQFPSVEIGIVIGGGNIFRGLSENAKGMDRVSADHMGMLATVINSLAMQDALEKKGIFTRVMSAIEMHEIAEPFIRRRAIRHVEKGRVVIFAAGTGNPYFTTDTAAVLRAVEIEADVILKGTRVAGIYNADPEKDKNALKYEKIEYIDVVKKGLKVMDNTAITLSMDNELPIIVFDMGIRNNLLRVVKGENVGTKVHS